MNGKQGFKARHVGWLRGYVSLQVTRAERSALHRELCMRAEVERQHAEVLTRLLQQGVHL